MLSVNPAWLKAPKLQFAWLFLNSFNEKNDGNKKKRLPDPTSDTWRLWATWNYLKIVCLKNLFVLLLWLETPVSPAGLCEWIPTHFFFNFDKLMWILRSYFHLIQKLADLTRFLIIKPALAIRNTRTISLLTRGF